jgi:hypothetical protein
MGAELAIHRRPHLVIALEGKADAVDRGDRHQGREDEARQGEELDAAGAHLRQHVGIAAELIVGEDLNLDPALRFLLDLRYRLAGADIDGVIDRRVVGVFVAELGGARAARQQHGAGGGACGGGDEGSAAQL